jgi:hypothetical protein
MPGDTGQVVARSTALSPPSAAASPRLPRGPRVDGRSAPARRTKALIGKFVAELGGADAVSEVQMLRVRRAAELTVASEWMRASALRGELIDPLALVRLENLASRATDALGLPSASSKPAETLPPLREYLAGFKAEAPVTAPPAVVAPPEREPRSAETDGAATEARRLRRARVGDVVEVDGVRVEIIDDE